MTVYVGSNRRIYPPSTLVERLEEDTWRRCCADERDGRLLVETDEEELLLLVPYTELDRGPGCAGTGDPARSPEPPESPDE